MLIKLWDFLFTRRKWETIEVVRLVRLDTEAKGSRYILRDQFGNIKCKDII